MMPENEFDISTVKELKYEQAYELLEQTVNRMNDASAPLDELVALYERGMALAEHCEELLKGYEARMEMVSRKALAGELEKLVEAEEEQ